MKQQEINEEMGRGMMEQARETRPRPERAEAALLPRVTKQLNNTERGPERQLSGSECTLLLQWTPVCPPAPTPSSSQLPTTPISGDLTPPSSRGTWPPVHIPGHTHIHSILKKKIFNVTVTLK